MTISQLLWLAILAYSLKLTNYKIQLCNTSCIYVAIVTYVAKYIDNIN